MDNRNFGGDKMTEQNEETLRSETWEEARKVLKTEVVHFTDAEVNENDNAYGVTYENIVHEYLRTAYSKKAAAVEVVSYGATYKVFNRGKVTAFYDADGNTIFDVENKRLKREYERLMKDNSQALESGASAKTKAKEKLEKEMAADKDKNFAEPVIGYLLERCAEDEGLAQDIAQEHKTWEKCVDYIYEKARKQAVRHHAAVRDEVVYEWAEDYYHKDDKAKEEEKARKEVERKTKQKKAEAEKNVKAKDKPAKTAPPAKKKEDAPKEQPKPKKNSRDMEGQLDMFSMMGM